MNIVSVPVEFEFRTAELWTWVRKLQGQTRLWTAIVTNHVHAPHNALILVIKLQDITAHVTLLKQNW